MAQILGVILLLGVTAIMVPFLLFWVVLIGVFVFALVNSPGLLLVAAAFVIVLWVLDYIFGKLKQWALDMWAKWP
jgi:hypothetical protein